jgi:CheY-like chemotaxis protein
MTTDMASEPEGNLVSAFAQALKNALDEISFPASPERISKLMDLLALSKPQVYRITTGKAAPTLESLTKLRELNISIDRILDQIRNSSDTSSDGRSNDDKTVNGKIEIAGIIQHCSLTLAPLTEQASIIAVLKNDHFWHVTSLAHGTTPPVGAMSVCEIQITNNRPRLAIVDDHSSTLTILSKQLGSVFNVSPFSEGKALINSPQVNQFDGYLLDWRLPDISGEELVMSIRHLSDAPIFVVTGEKSSHEIAKIIASANVRYVVKPIDEVILAAEILHAITVQNSAKNVVVG